MSSKEFDPTKPVVCMDGQPARIICTDRAGAVAGQTIVYLRTAANGDETIHTCKANGKSIYSPTYGLVNTPTVRLEYQNVYVDTKFSVSKRHPQKPDVERYRGKMEIHGVNVYRFEDNKLISVTFEPKDGSEDG